MGLLSKIYSKTEEARAKEKIRPLLESRMMRDILLEIGQRGTERLDPLSVPLAQREKATRLASECGTAGLKQCTVDEVCLDETGVTLLDDGEPTVFRYADYNYENIQDTDCLPAVAQYLVQHMRGYYNISRTFHTTPKPKGKGVEEHTLMVYIRRHHEDTPFDPQPVQKQKLF
ncbi:MAG: hypothetical protein PHO10_00310 [Gemmiger sp.]|nr:hypothetical protein [Gemmiger sp.]